MTVGDRLRQQRERANLSQGQVGKYEGVTPQYISDLERGRNNPPAWDLLARLAKRYGCTTDYLLGRTKFPNGHAPEAPISRHAREAIGLIDSLPPEKRPSAIELLRAIILFAEVGVPLPDPVQEAEIALPEPVEARDGGGGVTIRERTSTTSVPIWEMGADKPFTQLGLTAMEEPSKADLERRLALIKKMVPAGVYEYIVKLVDQGRPLSEADMLYLLEASEHKSLQEIIQRFENNHTIGNG
jgi:transcriptional regulator with XRE-family HTH domain